MWLMTRIVNCLMRWAPSVHESIAAQALQTLEQLPRRRVHVASFPKKTPGSSRTWETVCVWEDARSQEAAVRKQHQKAVHAPSSARRGKAAACGQDCVCYHQACGCFTRAKAAMSGADAQVQRVGQTMACKGSGEDAESWLDCR